jgi:hypothetical protein
VLCIFTGALALKRDNPLNRDTSQKVLPELTKKATIA